MNSESNSHCMPDFQDDSNLVNALEAVYQDRLLKLFMQVNPRKPEKGIRVLLQRARERVATAGVSLEEALEEVYQGAVRRTEARLKLLSQCERKEPSGPDSRK